MKRTLYHIVRLALVIIPVILTMASAMAQTAVYQGQTTEFSVEDMLGDSYEWEFYNDSTINFATDLGTAIADGDLAFVGSNTGPIINVNWLQSGVYFYKVTARDATGCSNNLKVGRIEILNALSTAIITAPPICIGDEAKLLVELTGQAPFAINYTDGANNYTITGLTDNQFEIELGQITVPTEYRITEITNNFVTNSDNPSNTVTLEVNPTPQFKSQIYVVE